MAGDLFGYTGLEAISMGSDGVAVSPVYTFSSETSLGLYRSAASTLALSYGTLSLPGKVSVGTVAATGNGNTFGDVTVAASGYTGTPLKAFSMTTCVMPAHVVQGSASSFTIFVWPAVRAGDGILVTVGTTGAISSLSSGLVLHSHCTVAGQCELRISNVSTLVQNQSAQTLYWYRFSGF